MASIIGLGFVGSAMLESFRQKGVSPLHGYDKYKQGGVGTFEVCLDTPIVFLCLPTLFDEITCSYNKTAIVETLQNLSAKNYRGIVAIKSTVEPGTTNTLQGDFPNLTLAHNPEFLSAATAFEDFHNLQHVVLGQPALQKDKTKLAPLEKLYTTYYSDAEISLCLAIESESMKSFVNSFYAVKVQFFNELYLMCGKSGAHFDTVRDLMLKNKWINPMHTQVPGTDGKLSYGGACFPKDTKALLQCMKRNEVPHAVLGACVKERNAMRDEVSPNTGDSSSCEVSSDENYIMDKDVEKMLEIEELVMPFHKNVVY